MKSDLFPPLPTPMPVRSLIREGKLVRNSVREQILAQKAELSKAKIK